MNELLHFLLHCNNTSVNSSVTIIPYLRFIIIFFAVRYCGELFMYTVHMYLKKGITATKIKVSTNLPQCSFWLLVLVFHDIELFPLYQNPYFAT